MAGKVSPTLQALHEIRDGVQGLERRMDRLEARMDGFDGRLDGFESRLDRLEPGVVEFATRVTTELVAVTAAIHEVRDVLKDRLDLRRQVEDHEHRIGRLEGRRR